MLSYGIVTPARNEAESLGRLVGSLAEQTQLPLVWLVVDNGSTDDTLSRARELSTAHAWMRVVEAPQAEGLVRGGPIVRAFHRGLAALDELPDVVVKLDADTSVGPDYFERLVSAFADDPSLGIASGTCYEFDGREWREQHMTGDHVWGASRAYRRECLADVLPLEERMGWDGIDALKAHLRGWKTRTLRDLPFRHHRLEGERDGARRTAYAAQGRAAHFMGYRFSYLVLRALHNARREPAAVSMIAGYVGAALTRERRCTDAEVRELIRREQRARLLPVRLMEALGKRGGS
jgi:glycosyltransferase involved in cell wall biosynthesis